MRKGLASVVKELNGTFSTEEVYFSDPIRREVVVEVKAAGLCHSDMNVATIDRGRPLPLIPGHELAGVVREVGPDVTTLKVGDHVVGTEVRACGTCVQCYRGRPTLCLRPNDLERSQDDGPRVWTKQQTIHALGVASFASYSVADERFFVPIPKEVPFAEACILGCAVTTGVGAALNVAKVRPGDSIAVYGIGGIGLNIIAGARLAGASRIIAVDVSLEKITLAKEHGATHGLLNDNGTLSHIEAIIPGGVDHAFDVVGNNAVTELALRSTTRGGSAYLIGIPAAESLLALDTMAHMIGDQRSLHGVYMGGTNPRRDIRLYADFFLEDQLRLNDMVSSQISIHEINDAYRQSERQSGVRTVVTNFSNK